MRSNTFFYCQLKRDIPFNQLDSGSKTKAKLIDMSGFTDGQEWGSEFTLRSLWSLAPLHSYSTIVPFGSYNKRVYGSRPCRSSAQIPNFVRDFAYPRAVNHGVRRQKVSVSEQNCSKRRFSPEFVHEIFGGTYRRS
jgi:hypothetical protein